MQFLRALFDASGRLAPNPFWTAAVGVYLAVAASQLLTLPDITSWAGLWPFAASQAALLWAWFALHAKRLRDAGRGIGPAVGVTVLVVVALALFLIVLGLSVEGVPDDGSGLIGVLVILAMLGSFSDMTDLSPFAIVLAGIVLIVCVPLVLALCFSIWAGTLPSDASARASAKEVGHSSP